MYYILSISIILLLVFDVINFLLIRFLNERLEIHKKLLDIHRNDINDLLDGVIYLNTLTDMLIDNETAKRIKNFENENKRQKKAGRPLGKKTKGKE